MHTARRVVHVVLLFLWAWAAPSTGEAGVGAARTPVADAGQDIATMVGVAAVVDGSGSHDPRGRLITFHWTIAEAPVGSAATLDASDPAPALLADLPGVYRLQLVVVNEDGIASDAATVTVVASARAPYPNARAGKARNVRVGNPVDLDARASHDALSTPLAFHWSMAAVPYASRVRDADIRSPNSAQPWFVPDVEGEFVLRVEVSNGQYVAEDHVVLTATAGNLRPVADVGPHVQAARESPFALGGSASYDPDGGPLPLAYAWSLVARPQSSVLDTRAIGRAGAANAS